MSSTVQLFIFTALVVPSVFAAVTPIYNVTSGLEDYTLLVGRQMQNELDIGDLQLASVKARHADRIETIANQQELVLQEVQQFDNIQLQQQAFSLGRKYCVQKYKALVPTYKEASTNFTECLNEAEESATSMTSIAEARYRQARAIREVDVPEIFSSCDDVYTGINLENCVTEMIDLRVLQFNDQMDAFQISLHESLYTSSVIVNRATHCSFVVEKKVLTAKGGVAELADACVEDLKKNGAIASIKENGNVIESKLMQRLSSGKKLIT